MFSSAWQGLTGRLQPVLSNPICWMLTQHYKQECSEALACVAVVVVLVVKSERWTHSPRAIHSPLGVPSVLLSAHKSAGAVLT